MIVSLLVAMDQNRGIGYQNCLPWRLSADLKHFKAVSMGHHLIMGRKTYESIGRLLPGRTTIVLSRQPDYAAHLPEGSLLARSLEEALAMAEAGGEREAFVIGGGEIFQQALPLADRIYLTRVRSAVQADTFFPVFNEGEWHAVEILRGEADEKNQYGFTIERLEKIRRSITQR